MIEKFNGRWWFLARPSMHSLWRAPPSNQWRCQQFHKAHGWWCHLSLGLRCPDVILCGFQTQKHKCTKKRTETSKVIISINKEPLEGFYPGSAGQSVNACSGADEALRDSYVLFYCQPWWDLWHLWLINWSPSWAETWHPYLPISVDTDYLGKLSEPQSPHLQNNST